MNIRKHTMRLGALIALVWAAPAMAYTIGSVSATQSGISALTLDNAGAGRDTSPIQMDTDTGGSWDTISFTVRASTVGTTTTVAVSCQDSMDNSAGSYTPVMYCNGTLPCVEDTRTFPWSAEGFTTTWETNKRWIKCNFLGNSGGTGAATVTAGKSNR